MRAWVCYIKLIHDQIFDPARPIINKMLKISEEAFTSTAINTRVMAHQSWKTYASREVRVR